jgi:hypothetical protein
VEEAEGGLEEPLPVVVGQEVEAVLVDQVILTEACKKFF